MLIKLPLFITDPDTEVSIKTHRTVRHSSFILAFFLFQVTFFLPKRELVIGEIIQTNSVVDKVRALFNDSYKKTIGSTNKAGVYFY